MSESTSIKLADGLKERVHALAKSRQRSANWMMNEAISQYVDRAERRKALLEEMKAIHREYQETGLHLTHEEVVEWTERLKTDPDAPMPKLHT